MDFDKGILNKVLSRIMIMLKMLDTLNINGVKAPTYDPFLSPEPGTLLPILIHNKNAAI